jgi:hypothetical protein
MYVDVEGKNFTPQPWCGVVVIATVLGAQDPFFLKKISGLPMPLFHTDNTY